MGSYAVIFTYSFDDEVVVYLFDTEKEATDFLVASFQEEKRIDEEENGWNPECWLSEDRWQATITNRFFDHEDVTEFRIGRVYL